MYRVTVLICALALVLTVPLAAQTAPEAELLTGANFIETKTYTDKENAVILKLYDGLRVADVSDGLDMVGLPNTGLVNPVIHPAWEDPVDLKHKFCGIAVTARFVPTQRPDRPEPGEDFGEWEGNFYGTYSSEAFSRILKPGSAVVLDDVQDRDIGTIGSNNIMGWVARGAVGVITDASSRDLDEVEKQGVPLYFRRPGRGIRPGRNELESVNRPVDIGGVLVCPGDVVVADGDGVVIVPRKVAEQVALNARNVLKGDKAGRLKLYEKLGIPLDDTVK
ncbi:RraA family protein [candidate division KSB1 bacterium]